jgi:hypothetical protein
VEGSAPPRITASVRRPPLGIEIDFGPDKPGAILQFKEKGHWRDYLVDGKPVVNPFDVEKLPPGFYRLVESPDSSA